jgi:hypothetical protein
MLKRSLILIVLMLAPTSPVLAATPTPTPTPTITPTPNLTTTRGPSQGECLQEFQVKHAIDDSPSPLLAKHEYQYDLTFYNRPTLDCDAAAYGTKPSTTTVASGKPFIIYVDRATDAGRLEVMRWSITTNPAGKTRLSYTFALPADYKFHVKPGDTATAGDIIDWSEKVTGPSPSASPAPAAGAASPIKLSTAPIVIILLLVLGWAAAAEYWHRVKKKRSHETPEEEYYRTPDL